MMAAPMAAGQYVQPNDGAENIVRQISEKLHDVVFLATAQSMAIEDAIVISDYVASPDPQGQQWKKAQHEFLRYLLYHGRRMSPSQFLSWKVSMFREWTRTVRLGYVVSPAVLQPLHSWMYPDTSRRWYWRTPEALYASDLTIAGNSALVFGDRKTGKSATTFHLFEILAHLHREHVLHGKNSFFYKLHYWQGQRARDSPGGVMSDVDDESGGSMRLGLFYAKGVRFIGNVETYPTDNDPDDVHPMCIYAGKLSDANIALARSCMSGEFSVLGVDEAGVTYKAKRATSSQNVFLDDEWRILGKVNAAMITNTHHTKSDLPTNFVTESRTQITKLSKTEALYTVRGLMWQFHLTDVPGCRIHYDKQEFPSFLVDMNPAQMFDKIAQWKHEAIERGDAWGVNENMRAVIEYCEKFRATPAQIAAGKNPALVGEIKYLLSTKNKATGEDYKDDEIIAMLECDRDLIEEVRRQLEAQKKAKERAAARLKLQKAAEQASTKQVPDMQGKEA